MAEDSDDKSTILQIKELTDTINRGPSDALSFARRGILLYLSGDLDAALADFSRAIELDPNQAVYHVGRSAVLELRGEYYSALRDCDRAIELDPNEYRGYCSLAGLLASCPDDAIRDGPRAIVVGEQAIRLMASADWRCFANVAAAYAECGDFPKAVKMAEAALYLAPDNEKVERQRRLDLFKLQKPFRKCGLH